MQVIKTYGAPGTGKTTDMLRTLEAELKAGVPLNKIAFATHTIDARDEAKQRAQKIIPSADEKDFRYFRTIHGICFAAIGLSKDVVMQSDDYIAFGERIGLQFSENWTTDVDEDGLPIGWMHSQGASIISLRQLASARMMTPYDMIDDWDANLSPKIVSETLTEFANWKAKESKFDFVDMLEMYLGDKHEPIDIKVMFIDEAQDLSKLQWAVVGKLMANCERVYIAGDDDQSIYSFIGADPLGFYNYPADSTRILDRTYRLRENIWDYSRKIVSQIRQRQHKEIQVRDTGGTIEHISTPFWEDMLDASKQTMIIARHNNMLTRLARKLEQRGIPFMRRGRQLSRTKAANGAIAYYLAGYKNQSIPLRDAANVARLFGLDGKQFLSEARGNPSARIDRVGLVRHGVYFGANWTDKIKVNNYERNQVEAIRKSINDPKIGVDLLLQKPMIDLQTYHSCKGREADNVILLTKCYDAAWEAALKDPDTERRLCYVGATRAKETLTIVHNGGTQYMRPLVHGG